MARKVLGPYIASSFSPTWPNIPAGFDGSASARVSVVPGAKTPMYLVQPDATAGAALARSGAAARPATSVEMMANADAKRAVEEMFISFPLHQ